jgi:hypothetical protein
MDSEDLSRKGFILINGIWVSDSLLFCLSRRGKEAGRAVKS